MTLAPTKVEIDSHTSSMMILILRGIEALTLTTDRKVVVIGDEPFDQADS